jgi:hypothetical protein
MLAFASGSCGPGPERAVAETHAGPLWIELDERPVLVGDVVERVESESYVYLRLSIISDSAAPSLSPHSVERWVAIERDAPSLGERVRVRSLARRSSVWDPAIERDFEVLEYVAVF